eukprot:TRINITY_DN2618_c0_g1_i3.p1 TRINITY_DN2618_c0_g1~~TRINITY_DN2618_c0_g1_i3.p1  ORF type:complete len:131 (+),score=24.20 TRINITY_DN2618_c0_g1_i3:627-1019(+)
MTSIAIASACGTCKHSSGCKCVRSNQQVMPVAAATRRRQPPVRPRRMHSEQRSHRCRCSHLHRAAQAPHLPHHTSQLKIRLSLQEPLSIAISCRRAAPGPSAISPSIIRASAAAAAAATGAAAVTAAAAA